MDRICGGRREQWDYIFNMNIIEFFNTIGYYTIKFKEINKELNKATTFESAVLGYLGQIVR